MYIDLNTKTLYFWKILLKLKFNRHIFEKYSFIKFNGKLANESRAVPCGRTDRHDVANGRLSQFCKRVKL
jgi:hypothetical protein